MQEHPDHDGVTPISRGTPGSTQGPGDAIPSSINPSRRGGGEMLDQARDTALQMVDQARDTAGEMVDQLKEQATARLAGQIERVTGELRGASTAIRNVGKDLREHDQGMLGGYAETVASQVNHAASYLEGKDLDCVIEDTERLARSRPGIFIGGAFLLGLAAARFLKSSSSPSWGSQTTGGMSTPEAWNRDGMSTPSTGDNWPQRQVRSA